MNDLLRPRDSFGAAAGLPRRLGRYTLTEVLGESAIGAVYKGIDPDLRRSVVVKTIHKRTLASVTGDLPSSERFRREAQSAGRLTHPNIVAVYEFGDDGDDSFIAMEFVPGRPLSHYLMHLIRLPVGDTLCVMVQLLDALHHAHERGVNHHDIRPGKLMLTTAGHIKVTGFGLARLESVDAGVGAAAAGFTAPELLTEQTSDRRADVFSCGALLYQLLTNAPPFLGTPDAVREQVLHAEPPPPSQAQMAHPPAPVFDAIVAKAMAKRAQDRYATAWELREALVGALPEPLQETVSEETVGRLMLFAKDNVTVPVRSIADGNVTLPASPLRRAPALSVVPPAPRPSPTGPVPLAADLAPVPSSGPRSAPAGTVPHSAGSSNGPAPGHTGGLSAASTPDSGFPSTYATPSQPAAIPVSGPHSVPPSSGWQDLAAESPAGCEPGLLAALETLLARRVGPVARVYLKRAVQQCHSPAEVTAYLAREALTPSERETFLIEAARVRPRSFADSSVPPSAGRPSTFGESRVSDFGVSSGGLSPLAPELLERTQRVLAEHMGPLAKILVKKAASGAVAREDFFARLAELAADSVDRETLLAQLWRLP